MKEPLQNGLVGNFGGFLEHFVCLLLNQQDIPYPSQLFTNLCTSNTAFIPQPPTDFPLPFVIPLSIKLIKC